MAYNDFYENDPNWIAAKEAEPRSECAACHAPIFTDKEGFTHKGIARLQRGAIEIVDSDGEMTSDDPSREDIKFEYYLCERCWLEDEDLCRFFNKIGLRVR
jgi:hypothetical protein